MAFTVKIAGVDKTSLIKAKTLITDLGCGPSRQLPIYHHDAGRHVLATGGYVGHSRGWRDRCLRG